MKPGLSHHHKIMCDTRILLRLVVFMMFVPLDLDILCTCMYREYLFFHYVNKSKP